jgi:regulator of replication initiation timing
MAPPSQRAGAFPHLLLLLLVALSSSLFLVKQQCQTIDAFVVVGPIKMMRVPAAATASASAKEKKKNGRMVSLLSPPPHAETLVLSSSPPPPSADGPEKTNRKKEEDEQEPNNASGLAELKMQVMTLTANIAAIQANNAAILSDNAAILANNAAIQANNTKLNQRIDEILADNAATLSDNAAILANNAAIQANNTKLNQRIDGILADNAATLSDNAAILSDNAAILANNAAIQANNTKLNQRIDGIIASFRPAIFFSTMETCVYLICADMASELSLEKVSYQAAKYAGKVLHSLVANKKWTWKNRFPKVVPKNFSTQQHPPDDGLLLFQVMALKGLLLFVNVAETADIAEWPSDRDPLVHDGKLLMSLFPETVDSSPLFQDHLLYGNTAARTAAQPTMTIQGTNGSVIAAALLEGFHASKATTTSPNNNSTPGELLSKIAFVLQDKHGIITTVNLDKIITGV